MSKFSSFALAACLLSSLSAVSAAQDISYWTTTRAEFGGTLGRIMRVVPGGSDPQEKKTSIHGNMMRVDNEGRSTIMDMDSSKFVFLDNPTRTYWTMEWGDIGEMWQQAAEAEMPEAERAAYTDEETRRTVTYDVSFDVDRTGHTERIAGYEAERVFLTFQMDAIEEDEENPDSVTGGTMVLLTELWISNDFPATEAMKRMRPGGQVDTEVDPMALSYDPRIGAAMERLQEEMEGLDGISLRTVSHFVAVPLELDFDRDAVLRDAERSLVADVADAAASSAVNSARRRLGGIAGRFGRRSREPEPPRPEQVVFMRVISEIHDVSEAPLDAGIFTVPDDYTERDPFTTMPEDDN